MDLAGIERSLRASGAKAIVTDARLVRRVIKAHRGIPGLGLQVPHDRCYALPREALLAIVTPDELGEAAGGTLPAEVVLLARPMPADVNGRSSAEVLTRLWRAAFHARVHVAFDKRFQGGALTEAAVRERIDHLGQTEFDEVRAILRADDLLLPPSGDREAWVEFAALWLELRHFAPNLLEATFPSLADPERVDALLAPDVEVQSLLEGSSPVGADAATVARPAPSTTAPTFSAPQTLALSGMLPRSKPSASQAKRLAARSRRAAEQGRWVRAALLGARGAEADAEEGREGRAALRAAAEAFDARLRAALAPPGKEPPPGDVEWTSLLALLAERSATRRGLRYPIEARLLQDLESAVRAAEHLESTVDLVSWALSFGKRPVVRALPATREVRILRHVRNAYRRVRYVRLPGAERKLLAKALTWANTRADSNVRGALRPQIFAVLDKVGIAPDHLPERVARDKLVEELLDLACLRGFVTLPHLRDAVSRNQLKLDDLDGVYELWSGDALLQADRRLDVVLDGVYRRGEVYLRALQKLSSLVFGTEIGRALTLFLLLPAGGAFIVLEAAQHLVNPIGTRLGFPAVSLVDVYTMGVGSLLVLALIHSALLRRGALRVLRAVGAVLMAVFFRVPRWLLALPPVQRFLRSRFFGALVRRVVLPLALTAAAVRFTPLQGQPPLIAAAGGAAVFAASSLALATRLGSLLEEMLWDWLAPTWRHLGRHVLPGLLSLVAGAFRRFSDLIERGIYTVDELLRFRQGQHWLLLPPKAMIGLAWFFVAYMIRVYFTLLIEPEVNPLKHFPVVTVAHKLFLPFSPGASHLISSALSFLGVFVASTIAWVTVFLLPSVCGFLAWELKENFRLYRQSRNKSLVPSHIGAHGETMHGLLVPGFHSGTVPKLYDRLRHAAQRQDELQSRGRNDGGDGGEPAKNEASLGRFRDGMVAVEDAVRRFVQRELCELLVREKRWTLGPLDVTRVELGSNRIRVGVRCPSAGAEACELSFEEQSGLLLASIVETGFVASLEDPPRTLFENALAGLYHLAGVDVVREQIEATLGADTPYDISEEGLVIWPGEGYRSEVLYALPRRKDQITLEPRLRGEPPPQPPRSLDARAFFLAHQPIAWADWVHAWSGGDRGRSDARRLVTGASLLPAHRPG
jgi:hypothetical protein